MSFQESSESLLARLHLNDDRKPLIIGVGLIIIVLFIASVLILQGPTEAAFSVSADSVALPEVGDADEANFVDGSEQSDEAADEALSSEQSEPILICVYVSGCVANPGVFYLEDGARLHDAVEMAGGLTSEAAAEAVNLARQLFDGEHIDIPDQESFASLTPVEGQGDGVVVQGGKVNINTATAGELVQLNGIGEATAEKIIADREANGPFKSIDDLTRVSGIGDKKLEAIRGDICI